MNRLRCLVFGHDWYFPFEFGIQFDTWQWCHNCPKNRKAPLSPQQSEVEK